MVVEGKASLDEPVRELLPAGTAAKPGGREIALLDLATHHSGLPPVPEEFSLYPSPAVGYAAYRRFEETAEPAVQVLGLGRDGAWPTGPPGAE